MSIQKITLSILLLSLAHVQSAAAVKPLQESDEQAAAVDATLSQNLSRKNSLQDSEEKNEQEEPSRLALPEMEPSAGSSVSLYEELLKALQGLEIPSEDRETRLGIILSLIKPTDEIDAKTLQELCYCNRPEIVQAALEKAANDATEDAFLNLVGVHQGPQKTIKKREEKDQKALLLLLNCRPNFNAENENYAKAIRNLVSRSENDILQNLSKAGAPLDLVKGGKKLPDFIMNFIRTNIGALKIDRSNKDWLEQAKKELRLKTEDNDEAAEIINHIEERLKRSLAIADMLIKKGICPNKTNNALGLALLFEENPENIMPLIAMALDDEETDFNTKNYKNEHILHLFLRVAAIRETKPNEYREIVSQVIDRMNKKALDQPDSFGDYPITLAVKTGIFELVQQLVGKKVDLNVQSTKGTPLEIVLQSLVQSKQQIEKNINLEDMQDMQDMLDIQEAWYEALQQEMAIAKLLIDHMDVNTLNQPDSEGNYPITLAVEIGSFKLVQQLVDKQVNLNVRDGKNNSPLEIILQRLVQSKMEMEKNTNLKGIQEAQNMLIIQEMWEKTYQQELDIAAFLIKEINNHDSSLPLILMLQLLHTTEQYQHYLDWAMQLIDQMDKNTLDKPDNKGIYPITLAVKTGSLELVQQLAKKKVNLNVREKNGTPLETLLQRLVQSKMEMEKNTNLKDMLTIQKMWYGMHQQELDIAAFLIKEINNYDSSLPLILTLQLLHGSTEHKETYTALARQLIEKMDKDTLDQPDSFGDYPITLAVKAGSLELVQQLVDKKVDLNVQGTKGTPLEIVLQRLKRNKHQQRHQQYQKDLEIAALLIKRGADLNKKNVKSDTTLWMMSVAIFWREKSTYMLFSLILAKLTLVIGISIILTVILCGIFGVSLYKKISAANNAFDIRKTQGKTSHPLCV